MRFACDKNKTYGCAVVGELVQDAQEIIMKGSTSPSPMMNS